MLKRFEMTNILGKDADRYFFKGQIISLPMIDGSMDVYRIVKMKHGRTWVKSLGVFPAENVKIVPKTEDKAKWKDKVTK
jgi:hypothetical protein